jgi:hypothetical protein
LCQSGDGHHNDRQQRADTAGAGTGQAQALAEEQLKYHRDVTGTYIRLERKLLQMSLRIYRDNNIFLPVNASLHWLNNASGLFLSFPLITSGVQYNCALIKVDCSVADPGCLSRMPDPTFFHTGSRIRTVSIPDPEAASKNLTILTPKKKKKWVLSSRKYDLGCSSRIPDPDADFLPIPDPGVKRAPDLGSGSATLVDWRCIGCVGDDARVPGTL